MPKKKIKYYAYDKETGKYIPPSKLNEGYYDFVISRTPPKLRRLKQTNFEFFGGGDYLDFVNWGSQGGRPRQHDSEAARQKSYRQRKSSLVGSYSHSDPRPGSYQYHSDRPASNTERVRKFRQRQKLLKAGL